MSSFTPPLLDLTNVDSTSQYGLNSSDDFSVSLVSQKMKVYFKIKNLKWEVRCT